MRNDTGIFNSQSFTNEYIRDLRRATIKSPAMFTIVSYAEQIAGRYEAALMLIRGGLTIKGERLAKEYETQLTLLAAYADEEAEVQAYPKPYPHRIEKEIIKLLLEAKERTDAEYPRELYEPRRAEYLEQITTKKVCLAGTRQTGS